MTTKWYENPANVLQLLREMNADQMTDLTVAMCLEVLAKPWNWSEEYERLCGQFKAGDVPTVICEGMLLMRPSDDEGRPAVVYAVRQVSDTGCTCEVVELRSTGSANYAGYVGAKFSLRAADLLSGKYTLEEDFQMEVGQ